MQASRRSFLKKAAVGAGLLALGASIGFGGARAVGLTGGQGTVITDREIDAQIIAGVRIATEFIPAPVPAGTDADPYPGSAIQAALNDGQVVYIPSGTWRLSSTIALPADNVTILGAGKSTKLLLDGATPCISAGTQAGWLIADLATDAGGVDVVRATQTRMTEVWVNGNLTDNRPIAGGSPPGSGGYYGVRASDFITIGSGTWADPWNGTAIQAAIDSLPRGGIVFIKEGVWGRSGEPRIVIGGSSHPDRKFIIQGAGSEQSAYGFDSTTGECYSGTQVRNGFDCFYPTDFYDLNVGPLVVGATPGIKYLVDPTAPSSIYVWLGGFTVRNIRVIYASPGIWFTGQNFGTTGASWQIWNAIMEHVRVVGGAGPAFLSDIGDADASLYPGQLELYIRDFAAQGVAASGGKRTFEVHCGNVRGVWEGFLLEGCGSSSSDYTFWAQVGDNGGLILDGIQFGDGSYSANDIYLSGGRQVEVRHITLSSGKGMTLSSPRGKFGPIANYINAGTISVTTGQQAEFLLGAPGLTTPAITFDANTNKANMLVRRWPGSADGYLGSSTPAGSPYTYQNLDMRNEIVYLVGGNVTGVQRNGQSVPTGVAHYLSPGDSLVVSWSSSAPTIKRFGV